MAVSFSESIEISVPRRLKQDSIKLYRVYLKWRIIFTSHDSMMKEKQKTLVPIYC
jgi:hypothetical protein